tara:strand:+ start:728 stop:994 length:267 start_codon:yes stop_codon:yes gene_type:complete
MHLVKIQYNNKEIINIDINELWYFKERLNDIEAFYRKSKNNKKNVLLKIPGTKKFKLINKKDFHQINKSIKSKIEDYKKEFFILNSRN